MNVITITWDGNEGLIKINPSFNKLYGTAKLDCIQDAIWELEQVCNEELSKLLQPKKETI